MLFYKLFSSRKIDGGHELFKKAGRLAGLGLFPSTKKIPVYLILES